MTCPTCGRDEQAAANFCSNCGRVLTWRVYPMSALPYKARFVRPREGRMIAGVCASIAQHNGWDVSLVRIIAVLLVLCTGVALLAYLAAWIIIPNGLYMLPNAVPYMPQQPAGTMGQ